uniref:GOLD domain-containing protein n=1 Tax=Calidris pygmaea TaxID=425635 RepID=A0A8C3JRP8_9CHAR
MRAGSGGMRAGMRAVVLALLLCGAGGTELTFELPDSDRQCFHQELERGTKFTLDYQVLREDPHPARTPETPSTRHCCPALGCPSTVPSSLGHHRRARAVPHQERWSTLLSPQMESACVTIHEALNTVIDSQTHYRLREAQDRSRAEDLNGRVSYWSVGETLILFVVSVGQVMLLKSFFTEKRPGSGGAGT